VFKTILKRLETLERNQKRIIYECMTLFAPNR
jgi:hypothetical protein